MKKLLLLPVIFTALTFTLVMADAKATFIQVPYAWSYQFSGSCLLGCNTNDINGNAIASIGAPFSLTLNNGIFGIPQVVNGFDLTDDNVIIEPNSAGIEGGSNFLTTNPFSNGSITPSDAFVSAPGVASTASGPTLPVDSFGNVTTGVYSGTNAFGDTSTVIDFDFLTLAGFPTLFSVTYSLINEEDNQVPVANQNTSFYTANNNPFWLGAGEWTAEPVNFLTAQITDQVSVPEPTTMGLMGLGLLGLVGMRKKKNT